MNGGEYRDGVIVSGISSRDGLFSFSSFSSPFQPPSRALFSLSPFCFPAADRAVFHRRNLFPVAYPPHPPFPPDFHGTRLIDSQTSARNPPRAIMPGVADASRNTAAAVQFTVLSYERLVSDGISIPSAVIAAECPLCVPCTRDVSTLIPPHSNSGLRDFCTELRGATPNNEYDNEFSRGSIVEAILSLFINSMDVCVCVFVYVCDSLSPSLAFYLVIPLPRDADNTKRGQRVCYVLRSRGYVRGVSHEIHTSR